VFTRVPRAPFRQNGDLVNVVCCLSMCLVPFHLQWFKPTVFSCFHTECCWQELVTFCLNNPPILTWLTRYPSIPAHLATSYIPNRDCHPRDTYEPLKSSFWNPRKMHLQIHPPWLCASSWTIFLIILLQLILYLLLVHSLPHWYTFNLHYSKWNFLPAWLLLGYLIPIINTTFR
jgi:hypothetical protein